MTERETENVTKNSFKNKTRRRDKIVENKFLSNTKNNVDNVSL